LSDVFARAWLSDVSYNSLYGVDYSSVEGVVDTPYAIADFSIDVHNATSAVPVLWWRSVGHSYTAHVMETMIDEMAQLAGQDPVAFRLGLLAQQPRDAAVLRLATQKAGWDGALPKGQGLRAGYSAFVASCGEGGSFARGPSDPSPSAGAHRSALPLGKRHVLSCLPFSRVSWYLLLW
jgi:CO/xanthine dehydrogenase Mo-binding subunit